MKKTILALLTLSICALNAQTYQPNWESLDARPVPQWYQDAKFGIFIHWGVYAVPGWSTKGNYAEWYQYGLQTNDTARMRFHKEKFGSRSYYDLANDFKAELFNPDEWARLFERSGAKYIVLTSNIDGFTLWPSAESDRDWGFKWNAVDVGPRRDLLCDLFKAVRKTSVHAGMYYSLYEWFNPLWKSDRSRFATEHTWPQMKELINNYQPDVFWTDGDWEAPAETWKSQEFLAWLYNLSPVKDRVVVNDRWGAGIRFKHGGIYTPEYQPGLDFEDHYWEESRGMGYSYGYNREEDAWDYNSTQSLVIALIDKVSRGGNFLLDIGPDEHGKIPPIMQERLLEIGDWLKINGEAIYNTSRWKTPSQWSEGRKDYKGSNEHITGDWKTGGDIMLKLTVDPDPGYAVKEVFYTYNAKTNALYGIFPKYPGDHKLVLRDITLPEGTKMRFLSTDQPVSWRQAGSNVEVNLPGYDPNKMKAPYAYVVKIENYGKFAPKPEINLIYESGRLEPLVKIYPRSGAEVHITTDGSEPTESSPLYTAAFLLHKTAVLKAKGFDKGRISSAVDSVTARVYQWQNAKKVSKLKQGVAYKYFEPSGKVDMNFSNGAPVSTGIADFFSNAKKLRKDRFGFEFTGYIKIDKDGIYQFSTLSDDGSKLLIDDTEVVDNDGDHGSTEKSGKAALRKGYHKIKLLYYDGGGDNELKAYIWPDGGNKAEIPASILFH
jgi:alpha-L-fucosidase